MPKATTTIYLYHCNDGTVRQRCRRHIIRKGEYAPSKHMSQDRVLIRTFEAEYPARYGCVACHYERYKG